MTPPNLLAAREGFSAPGLGEFEWPSVIDLSVGPVDVGINRIILIMFFATALVSIFFLMGSRRRALVPRGAQNLMEYGIEFVRKQIMQPAMGAKGEPYLPYLTTIFFFIFGLNVMGVFPFLHFPPTSKIAIPLFLAFTTYIIFIYAGVKSQGAKHYFGEIFFPPGVPKFMYVMLTPIEVFSTLIVRPLSLAIRLFANMVAGHLMLVVVFFGIAYMLGSANTAAFGALTAVVSVGLVGFEVFVAGLQAFIFTILTAVYIAGSLEPAH